MIGEIIGAAAGLGGGLYGMLKSASQAKKQQQLINEQEAKNNAWYERNYYGNYLDNSTSQAAIKRVEDTLRNRNQEARAEGAITGATPEESIAKEAKNNELLDNVITNLASNTDAQKRHADEVNLQNENNITNERIAQSSASESGAAEMGDSSLGIIGTALSELTGGDEDKTNKIKGLNA